MGASRLANRYEKMVSGKPLSAEEKNFIRNNHHQYLNGTMASMLAESFGDYNGGFRSNVTVKRFLRAEGLYED